MKRKLKNWLATYLNYTRLQEAPEHYHLWTGISVLASALGGKVFFDQATFKIKPNFYIVLVSKPGVGTKSTAIQTGYNLVRGIREINLGGSSGSWQGLLTLMTGLEKKHTLPTGEQITSTELNCVIREFGTFLKVEEREFIDVITSWWDNSPIERRTLRKEDIIINEPFLNLIGGTTPKWLLQNLSSDILGSGLGARMIFVIADKKRHSMPIVERTQGMNEEEEDLKHDLKVINTLKGRFKFTPEAQEEYSIFHCEMAESKWPPEKKDENGVIIDPGVQRYKPPHLKDPVLDDYCVRASVQMLKLAMVFSVARGDDLTITLPDWRMARAIGKDMELGLPSILKRATTKNPVAFEIYDRLAPGKTYNEQAMWRLCMDTCTSRLFEEALRSLVNSGMIRKSNGGYQKAIS